MLQPTQVEINNNINTIQEAMRLLKSFTVNATSNSDIDKHVSKAYSELSKGYLKLTVEATLSEL